MKLSEFLQLDNTGQQVQKIQEHKKGRGLRELKNLEWDMNDNATSTIRSEIHRKSGRVLNTIDP